MPPTHPRYPQEYRQQVVELVRAGRTPEELAREFEPSAQTIRNWVKQADLDEGRRHAGLTTAEREELSRLLEVSTSGYYAWLKRPPSRRAREDVVLAQRIGCWIHLRSRGTYGAPRIHAELADEGVHLGRKRVARLMRALGLKGVSRRKDVRTTVRQAGARPAPDLVQREFSVPVPNRLWVADITFIATWSGFPHLPMVLDAWSRRVVGWAMASHLRTELVPDALGMAIQQGRPSEVIRHFDQGSQYTSIAFGRRCREAGVRPSMGSVGDCYDNAVCESFFATLVCELLDRRRFCLQHEAWQAVFEFIEGWHNPHRRHSSLGYASPARFEMAAAHGG